MPTLALDTLHVLKVLVFSPFQQKECFGSAMARIKVLKVHKILAWQFNIKPWFLYPINFDLHWTLLHVSKANILCA